MKLSKKVIRIIVIILAIAVLIPCCYFSVRIINSHVTARQRFADFDACQKELYILLDYLLIKYGGSGAKPASLTVANGTRLYDPKLGYVSSGELCQAINNVYTKGFGNGQAPWSMIRFDGNRIQFETANGEYALVYSPDGEPEYLHTEDEIFRVLVEHIEDHWYHVSKLY